MTSRAQTTGRRQKSEAAGAMRRISTVVWQGTANLMREMMHNNNISVATCLCAIKENQKRPSIVTQKT